jgi:hypothetical protein
MTSRTVALPAERSLRDAAHDDVAVRHHPDQAVVLADRQGTEIVGSHLPGSIPDRRVRTDQLDLPAHDLLNLHGLLLFSFNE